MRVEDDDFYQQVINLKGEEKIFVRFDSDMAKDLNYISFKKDGLQNSVMSYINATHEAANMVNFEKFVERIALLKVEENQMIKKILDAHLPEKIVRYVMMPHPKHTYTIDVNNEVIVIEPRGSAEALHSHFGNGHNH